MNPAQLAAYLRRNGIRQTSSRAWTRSSQALEMNVAKLLRRSVVTTRYGVRMRANWSDATFRFCYFGSYGNALADLLDRYREPFVFIDIGANQGLYSLIAARNTNCRSVLAFEPVPATFQLLRANMALNDTAAAKVHCMEAGIGAERCRQRIHIDPAHTGLSSLRHNHARQAITQTIELVTHREVDELLQRHAPGDSNLVVKIDVEGYEEIVASELVQLACAGRIQSVFYEADERWTSQSALRATFEAGGFSEFATFIAGTHHDVLATRPVSASMRQSAMTA